jgi:hypothetical protein
MNQLMRFLLLALFGTALLSFAQTTTDVHPIGALFNNGGKPLVAGRTIYYAVPYGCMINGWDMTVDLGTASIDVWKISGSVNYLPTSANTITGGNTPAVLSGQHVHSSNTTNWHHTVSPHNAFGFYLKYVTRATRASLVLQCQ